MVKEYIGYAIPIKDFMTYGLLTSYKIVKYSTRYHIKVEQLSLNCSKKNIVKKKKNQTYPNSWARLRVLEKSNRIYIWFGLNLSTRIG